MGKLIAKIDASKLAHLGVASFDVKNGTVLRSILRNSSTEKITRYLRQTTATLLTGLLISLLLFGCAEKAEEPTLTTLPTPTVNVLLSDGQQAQATRAANSDSSSETEPQNNQVAMSEPTVASVFDSQSGVKLVATPTRRPIASTKSELNRVLLGFGSGKTPDERITEVLVFDDKLDSSWALSNSANVDYNAASTDRWYDELDANTGLTSGAMSISLKPNADFGQLFFTVRPDSTEVYHRDEILGVSFWMYSGADIIDTGDFAVTVVGSNEQRYWSPDDKSVFFQEDDSFSETALYFLDINRAIPANSWIKIEVWLDELLFDPDYQYVTGVYIKNDAGFRNRIYVDRLTLLKLPEA